MLEDLNQDVPNMPENIPPPQPKSPKIKKRKSLLTKESINYIPQILINFNMSEENNKLDEMLSDLEYFRKVYKEEQKKNLPKMKFDSSLNPTKLVIYNALEKNLIELSYMENKEIRNDRINSLYSWYKLKNKINEDLKRINIKSYKEKDEINDLDLLEEKKNYQNENNNNNNIDDNFNDDRKIIYKKISHRNDEIINKKMLEFYNRKILSDSLEDRNADITNSLKEIENNAIPERQTRSTHLGITYSILHSQDYSNGDFSTFYTYKNGTNILTLRKALGSNNELNYMDQAKGGEQENNFFPKYNKDTGLYFPPLNRETKFSYSFNRPPYNFNNMVIENKIKESKLKVLSEKRGREEIKEHLEKFGIERAKYKENMNNKYELRSVINMYVNSFDFNSPLLEKVKKAQMNKSNSMNNINKNNLYHTLYKPANNFTIGKSTISQNEEKEKEKKPKISENDKLMKEFENIVDDNRIEFVSPNVKEQENTIKISPRKMRRNKSQTQMIKPQKKLYRIMEDKIRINEIKNIDINNKNILEQSKSKINKIKLKIKNPKDKMQFLLINSIKKKSDNNSPDAVGKLISNDGLFKEKNTYEQLCNAKLNNKALEKTERENKSLLSTSKDESESEYHNFCLSMYDPGNIKKINDNITKMNKFYGYNNLNSRNLKETKIKFNKLHKTFHLYKDNFLNLRRTMSDWKRSEYWNLLNEIKKNDKNGTKEGRDRERDRDRDEKEYMFKTNSFKNIRMQKQNSLLDAMINPKDGFRYSQYFLPRSGSMLLSRNEEPKTKKKK